LPDIRAEAFFLPRESGQRFCILYEPGEQPARGSVLYVHPFAEEMNKCRRMAALGARALARAGWAVLQLDLLGCGDSTGRFGEAGWDEWLSDARAGCTYLQNRFGASPWLWGARAGALLACEAGAQIEGVRAMVLWQPVVSGRQHLTHFLRLKLAREALGGTADRDALQAVRARLQQGQSVEVSGYELSPSLASGFDSAELVLPDGIARVAWLDVSSAEPPSFTPASLARIAALRERGARVDARVIAGPAFWQTVEIEECEGLVAATVEALAAE
jgi:exosortase A-associated hydrolase 2